MAFVNTSACLVAALALITASAGAQTRVSLREAAERKGADLAPALEWQNVIVQGIVAAGPLTVTGNVHVAIQDSTGAGLTLQGTSEYLAALHSGQEIEVVGILNEYAGLPILRVSQVRLLRETVPPAAQKMTVAELNNVSNLGRYVEVEGRVQWAGQNAGGEVLAIGNSRHSVLIFCPYSGRRRQGTLGSYKPGDLVRATGISAQYCPVPPFNRTFEVIVPGTSAVTLLAAGWVVSPMLFGWVLLAAVLLSLSWWVRERKLSRQRKIQREIMAMAEDVISAASPVEIARRLESGSQQLLGAPDIELYLYTEGTQTLDRVVTDKVRSSLSVPLSLELGSVHALHAVCFRNRAMLAVPDLRRTPLVTKGQTDVPASAVLAPMITHGQLLGIIALFYRRRPDLSADFQVAVQHLANQVAASMKLQERQLMKEQLLRSEKMAAAGQLISGVATDLRLPLANVARSTRQLLERADGSSGAELREIASEAGRGLELVDHLVSFSHMEKREPRPLDVHGLASSLLDMRAEEQGRRGIFTDNRIPIAPVEVLADRGQLEQALLTAIVHAEHAAASAPDRQIRVTSLILGARVQLAFESSAPPDLSTLNGPTLADYFGFPVAQAILQSHGGDLRSSPGADQSTRVEVELPVLSKAAVPEYSDRPSGKPARVLTALIIEPDVLSQRRLLGLLAAKGHRAIPVTTPEEATEMVQRIHFDLLFSATQLPGLSWLELFHRVRRRIGVFALLTDGITPETAQAFSNGEGQVLSKPVTETDLDEVLGVVEVRWAVSRR